MFGVIDLGLLFPGFLRVVGACFVGVLFYVVCCDVL